MLRIALQSKGRLNEESLAILKDAGIKVDDSKRRLLSKSTNYPIEILYLRDDDIPQAVANGIADIGIVGLNEVKERGVAVDELFPLGFGKCRLSLAIPKEEKYSDISYFNKKKIATSYPNILREYFKEKGVECIIEEIAGSVEIAPSIGMTDAIFDIVSSGSTLISNGLSEIETVMESEAVVIGNPTMERRKKEEIEKLIFRFDAVKRSRGKKYLLANIPNDKIDEALRIIPSMKSPSLLPLADKKWSAIQTVIDENEVWEKTTQLKAIGAEDILILSLEKMII